MPAGVQLFSLFEANPHLIDLIVDICATAPGLARFLGRNSAVLDAVIGGGFFSDWPSQNALVNSAAHILSQHSDYEGKLDAIRRWQKELHFRIGVHFLRGLIDAQEASAQYGQLAEAVVVALFPAVCEEFAAKHGTAPGRGAAILAMGSLGSGTLSATSDLDLILIYDALDVTSSDGRRPLATQAYFARLTQALVTALSAPTAAGRLYEVDMRLRPSGRQGPVATAISSFENYQKSDAWTWEHLALTRARPIAGPDDLKRDLLVIIREVLAKPRDRAAVFADVADMRARLADAKPSQFDLDVKAGPGGMTDIELMAQTGALLAGSDVQDTLKQLNSMPADWAANGADAGELAAAHSFLGTIQQVMRLLDGDAVGLDDLGAGGLELMLRATGADDAAQLQKKLENTVGNVDQMISNVLGKP